MRSRNAFTLVELMIVVTIVIFLAVAVVAPYSYYSDLAKLRLSVSKIEQVFAEAKVAVAAGATFPGGDHNADAYVTLSIGSDKIPATFALSSSGFALETDRRSSRTLELEKDVVLDGLPAATVVVVCRAPLGECSSYAGDGSAIVFTGGVVRLRNGGPASISKPFRFQTLR